MHLCLCLTACEQKGKPRVAPNTAPPSSLPKSSVPLRVWMVAGGEELTVIERQWQATYDRSVETQAMTAAELLAQSGPQCDVLVYPASLLGEMIARGWVTELPSALQSQPVASEANETVLPLPAGWLEQARYGRKLWGVSLGVVAPVIVANFPLPATPAAATSEAAAVEQSLNYWRKVVTALQAQHSEQVNFSETMAQFDQPDALALADRFLTIFFSIHHSQGRVGVMFDPESLQPRIDQPDALAALQLLLDLAGAGASPSAILGSHLTAWQAMVGEKSNVTICIPPPPSPEVDKVTNLEIQSPPNNPLRAGAQASASINSGRGLVASLTTQCQQTGTSVEFVRWLASQPSREGVGRRIAGMWTELAYAPGSSAWQAQRLVQRLSQHPRLPSEPRLTQADRFREVLGQEILRCLQGTQSAQAALQATHQRWLEIIAAGDRDALIKSYHQSLGL